MINACIVMQIESLRFPMDGLSLIELESTLLSALAPTSLSPRLGLQPGGKSLLPSRILALSRDQDRGEIQLIHQIEPEINLVVIRESVTG